MVQFLLLFLLLHIILFLPFIIIFIFLIHLPSLQLFSIAPLYLLPISQLATEQVKELEFQ
jgi:hypothetical protein